LETRRLKNIAILLLLTLNAFLLLLLGYQYFQSRRTASDAAEQLTALFAANGLSLSRQIDLFQEPLSPLTLSRHTENEAAIAAYLLGDKAAAADQGGGIYSYSSPGGTLSFRSGGGYDGSGLSVPVSNITDFSRQFCNEFGYQDVNIQVSNRTGTVTATQYVAGVPISGCGVTLYFESGVLTAASGSHISLEGAVSEGGEQVSCVTALVRFLDRSDRTVCREVEDIRCVYVLKSTPSSLRLTPVWQVGTDTYTFFVDGASGEVSRR